MKDDRIKDLYKNEIARTAPDKELLWKKIESDLTESTVSPEAEAPQSDADNKPKRNFITLKKCLGFAAVCAVIALVIPTAVNRRNISTENAVFSADNNYGEMAADSAESYGDFADNFTAEESVSSSDSLLSYDDLDFPEGYDSGLTCSGEPNGGEYFSEDDILEVTECFIDAVVNNVYAGGDCIYYELSKVNVYGEDTAENITVASRSKYRMLENREYLIPVKSVDGEFETVYDGVPQMEFTSDGGLVYYNGWRSLDSENSSDLIYPQSGVDDYFYDRMKFSYSGDISALIEKWTIIQGG